MSTSLSKRHVNQLNYANALHTALETHHDAILESLEQQGLTTTGLSSQLRALSQNVMRQADALRAALGAVTSETGDDDVALRELEAASRELLEAARFTRERILSVFGPEWARRYAVSSSPVGTRVQLLNWSREVVSKLEAHPRQAQDRLGSSLDTTALHDLLRPLHDTYAQRLDHYSMELRQTDGVRATRDLQQETLQSTLTTTALILEGYLRMAKLHYQADRIRPTLVRTRGEEPIVEEPAPNAQDTPA